MIVAESVLRGLTQLALPTLLLPAAVALSALGCDPFHVEFEPLEDTVSYRANELTPASKRPSSLVLMNYNVKFGGARIDFFFDCHGDRVLMTQGEVLENLEQLATKIRQVDPDVLFLQEVDVASKRAAYVDQLQWLLDHTRLNYAEYASQWRADFVPSDGIGPVDSGNAILSKYPLTGGTRIALPLRSDQPALDKYFYLRRNLIRAHLDIDPPIALVGVHTDAYSKDGTKLQHIQRFEQELDVLAKDGNVIGAGDLNTVPPGTNRLRGFPDSVCTDEDFQADDYSEEMTWLESLYSKYEPAISLEDYQANNTRFFTHTTDGKGFWNRTLDYIFTNGNLVSGTGLVHQEKSSGGMDTMPISDHAPVSVTIDLR
ncbi:MAG: hypothetical protein RJA70_1307 [Pseudomonadota bacterium]|jgi:endonuclease/exonuclease/phosphatase family metal-dependent hydrolase